MKSLTVVESNLQAQLRAAMFHKIEAAREAYDTALRDFGNSVGPRFRVGIQGSSLAKPGDALYSDAFALARIIGLEGIGIVSGGYLGVGDAVLTAISNLPNSHSIGIDANAFRPARDVNATIHIDADSYELRTDFTSVMCAAYVFFPGGLGTEMLRMWILQHAQISRNLGCDPTYDSLFFQHPAVQQGWIPPVIMIGKFFDYVDTLVEKMKENGTISPGDDLLYIRVNTVEEALEVLRHMSSEYEEFCKRQVIVPSLAEPEVVEASSRKAVIAWRLYRDSIANLAAVSGVFYRAIHFGSTRPRRSLEELKGYPKELATLMVNAYNNAKDLAKELADARIDLVCGGGPGIMEASMHGVTLAGNGAKGFGAALRLPRETPSPYIGELFSTLNFGTRLQLFGLLGTDVVVDFGGFGTWLELIWVSKILQFFRKRREQKPQNDTRLLLANPSVTHAGWEPKIILIGEIWSPIEDMLGTMLKGDRSNYGFIGDGDLDIFMPVANHEQALATILARRRRWRNFVKAKGLTPEN